MTNEEILDLFFSGKYEDDLNEKMLDDRFFVIPGDGILNYMCNILYVPYVKYLDYIQNRTDIKKITSTNITQSSSFESCEKELVSALINDGNRGLTFDEIGALFPKKVKNPNDTSLRKYGENQVKTAKQLGLTFEYYNHWYLNCICYIYNDLDKEDQEGYLARALLRDPLYRNMMVDILNRDIDLIHYMGCIKSAQTQYRRYDSVHRLLQICLNVCNREGIKTFKVLPRKHFLQSALKQEEEKKALHSIVPIYDLPTDESIKMVADNHIPLGFYVQKFSKLHCYKSEGKRAPHKALLLLSIMNLIETGVIKTNIIEPTLSLSAEFTHLTATMEFDRKLFTPAIENPYIHLAGDGFWKINSINDGIKVSRLNQVTNAVIDEELYAYMSERTSRNILRQVLLDNYFE